MSEKRYKAREWLVNKYRVQECSTRKIGMEEGADVDTIRNWLIRFGIERRRTNYYRELSALRKLWYPDGVKIVPKQLELNPLTTKLWFLEDGSAFTRSNGKRAINFCTNNFEKEDTKRLAQMLRNELNQQKIRINKADGRGYLIVINRAEIINGFFDYVGGCPKEIEGIFGYKWEIAERNAN